MLERISGAQRKKRVVLLGSDSLGGGGLAIGVRIQELQTLKKGEKQGRGRDETPSSSDFVRYPCGRRIRAGRIER